MWPYMFDKVPDEYDRRYGVDEAHLHQDRRDQPRQRQAQPERPDPRLGHPRPRPERRRGANPSVEGRIRRFDCSQITDGGAGVVLVSDEFLARNPMRPGR